jgi:hypothetical protein
LFLALTKLKTNILQNGTPGGYEGESDEIPEGDRRRLNIGFLCHKQN